MPDALLLHLPHDVLSLLLSSSRVVYNGISVDVSEKFLHMRCDVSASKDVQEHIFRVLSRALSSHTHAFSTFTSSSIVCLNVGDGHGILPKDLLPVFASHFDLCNVICTRSFVAFGVVAPSPFRGTCRMLRDAPS